MSDELCAICNVRRADHWDHDHESGLIRGRLCGRCNRGLGFLEWADQWLVKALAYLADPPLLGERRHYADIDRANHRRAERKYNAKPEAQQLRREYQREWRARNRGKILMYQSRDKRRHHRGVG